LPFYILHQLVVLTVAVIVVQWRAGIGVKIIGISSVAFAVTMVTYELVIRRNRVLRVLFRAEARRRASDGPRSQRAPRRARGFSSWR